MWCGVNQPVSTLVLMWSTWSLSPTTSLEKWKSTLVPLSTHPLSVCVEPHSSLSVPQAEGAITESIPFNDTDSVMCQLHQFEVKTSVGEAFSSPTIERVALPLSESRPHPTDHTHIPCVPLCAGPNVEGINASATPILGEDEILIELVFEVSACYSCDPELSSPSAPACHHV